MKNEGWGGLTVLATAMLVAIPAAAQTAPQPHHPTCEPLVKFMAGDDGKTKVAIATPGQFRFLQGLYVASPSTPQGLPPGTGARILSREGADNDIILWTVGKLVCDPIPLDKKIVDLMGKLKDAPGDDL